MQGRRPTEASQRLWCKSVRQNLIASLLAVARAAPRGGNAIRRWIDCYAAESAEQPPMLIQVFNVQRDQKLVVLEFELNPILVAVMGIIAAFSAMNFMKRDQGPTRPRPFYTWLCTGQRSCWRCRAAGSRLAERLRLPDCRSGFGLDRLGRVRVALFGGS